MKEEEKISNTEKVILLVNEVGRTHQEKFNILMTSLTWFFATNAEDFDSLMNGIEEELKRLVKSSREMLRKGVEKE